MSREYGPSPEEMQGNQTPEKIVPNYRKPFRPVDNPNFAGQNYEKRAEGIQHTLEQVDQLIATIEDQLESAYRNSFLKLLIGMQSALMDEYYRLAKPEWYSGANADPRNSNYGVGSTKLHPATLDQFEQALSSWGLEIRKRNE